jgi:hypothetical protein
MMALWSSKPAALDEVLTELGFSVTGQSGVFVTYERARDSVKVHVAPDGMFAAFNTDDDIIGEGEDADDLRSVLLEAVFPGARGTLRQSFLKRRTRQKNHPGERTARSRDEGAAAHADLSASAFK